MRNLKLFFTYTSILIVVAVIVELISFVIFGSSGMTFYAYVSQILPTLLFLSTVATFAGRYVKADYPKSEFDKKIFKQQLDSRKAKEINRKGNMRIYRLSLRSLFAEIIVEYKEETVTLIAPAPFITKLDIRRQKNK